jgi:F-box interacting protein
MSSNNLPSEVIEAILVLLPAKSLRRFKSVSKTWKSLISDPQFIKTHLLHLNHQTRKLIALSTTTRSLYSIDISETLIPATGKELSFPIRWKEILGSCNELVLAKDENNTIFVMNPTAQAEVWKVPACPFAPPDEDEGEEVYVNVKYGFGYDSFTDDYKIHLITSWHQRREHGYNEGSFATVYSLLNNSWRKLPDYCYDTLYGVANGVLVNQNLHWLSVSFKIIGFNIAKEEWSEMELPHAGGKYPTCIGDLVDVGGKLGVFMRSKLGFECCVMEEYGVSESWTKLVRIHGVDLRSLSMCV